MKTKMNNKVKIAVAGTLALIIVTATGGLLGDLLGYVWNLFSFDKEHPLLFTQFNFWAFFLIVFAGFCLVKDRRHWRNAYLFAVSLLFYFKTSGLFVVLLIFSTILGYYFGIGMDKRKTENGKRKALMIAGVTINLLVLFYFKYAYFFIDIHNTLFHTDNQVVNHLAQFANHFTKTPRFDTSLIMLPVGISFFTFQNISYIVDVYKRKISHVDNILDFGFYTTFFPQLVAGPIVRADRFVPQIYRPYFVGRRQFGIAVFWILNGLIKKIVLSDYLAVNFVDRVFDNPLLYTGFENLSALFIYSLQVYADFSGYTDIAIGVAMLMGFYLPQNFNSPYKATNPAGFWKRWHISLSNWLKDYLYIPLGGNRTAGWPSYLIMGGMLCVVAIMAQEVWVTIVVGYVIGLLVAVYFIFPGHRKDFKTNINNMDTMLLGGLWHGASFNFITWGGLNGIGILVYKWWKKLGARSRVVATMAAFALLLIVDLIKPLPVFNLGCVWSGIICTGTIIRYFVVEPLCGKYHFSKLKQTMEKIWNIFLTFIFISFTRLFFRSGSNLDPAEANRTAWETAKCMIERIGSRWEWGIVGEIVSNYSGVFCVFLVGMVIHWLPEDMKRRYRLSFALMPIWAIGAAVVVTVFIVYQFISADLQPFIYFQF